MDLRTRDSVLERWQDSFMLIMTPSSHAVISESTGYVAGIMLVELRKHEPSKHRGSSSSTLGRNLCHVYPVLRRSLRTQLSLIRLGGRVANGLVVGETALELSFVSSQVSPLQASAGKQDDSRMLEDFRSKASTSAASFSASASKTKPAFCGGTKQSCR